MGTFCPTICNVYPTPLDKKPAYIIGSHASFDKKAAIQSPAPAEKILKSQKTIGNI